MNLMRSTKDKSAELLIQPPQTIDHHTSLHPLAKNLFQLYSVLACISYKQATFRMIIATKSDAEKHA